MKDTLKNAIAEIENGMGELEGLIIIAGDGEHQFSLFEGKCYKMLKHLTDNNREMLDLFDDAIKDAKLEKAMQHYFETQNKD